MNPIIQLFIIGLVALSAVEAHCPVDPTWRDVPVEPLSLVKDLLDIITGAFGQPKLVTKNSQLFDLPSPWTPLIPQDRSKCPFLDSDLKHWHDPATWGGQVPSPDTIISLPNNTKVLISSCSLSDQVYRKIYVPPSSSLVFSDSPITWNVKDILVDGTFIMGTQECRINSNIRVIFHGDYTPLDTIAPRMGSKGLAISRAGFASIHGKQYTATWTRLAASVNPGDRLLYVQDNINWEAGQEIVLTTSRHEDTENEVATIASVVGRRILLAKPLKYYHHGDSDYQIEVGLLSRRIKFMGAEDSHASSFGGHVMAMGESQFAGIECVNMGQLNVIARYPLHYHLAGLLKSSYITDNSMHHSFFRATTIHGTHNATVAYNVAYDVMGHGVYLEDGVEENNTIAHNLMANIQPIGVPLTGSLADVPVQVENNYSTTVAKHPSDCISSCYFISNAYNNFYGNAASGGWAGYLFPSFNKVVGPSQLVFNTTGIIPYTRPTLRFEGNSAHSSGSLYKYGGSFYFGGKLTEIIVNPALLQLYLEFRAGYQGIHEPRTRDSGIPTSMSFVNTKVFLSNNGFSSWANRIDINGYESHDNIRATQIFGQSSVKNALVNGKTHNPIALLTPTRVGFPVLSSDAQSIITSTEFRNFFGPTCAAFVATSSPFGGRVATTVTKAIRYTNVDNVFGLTNSAPFFNLIDSDGSATCSNGRSTLVGSSASKWWDHDANCQSNRLNVWICSPKRPEVEVASIKLTVPSNLNKGRATLFGTNIPDASVALDLDSIVGVSNAGWHIALNAGSPVTQDITPVQVPFGHFVIFAMSYPSGTTFTITTSTGRTVSQVGTSIQSLVACTGDGYYFDGQNLYIKLIDSSLTGSSSEYFERSGLRVYNANQSAPNYRVTATCPQSRLVALSTVKASCPVDPTWRDVPVEPLSLVKDLLDIITGALGQPNLVTKNSQLFDLPSPWRELYPQDRSKCPHLENGLKHWHDPATWGGQVPSPDTIISLPNNTKVLISSCSLSNQVYRKIYIPPSSSLVFSDSPITLNVKDILVDGTFIMGTQECRINSDVRIIFHGEQTDKDTIAPRMGSKGMAISRSGFASVHGKQYTATWTRLAASVNPGDRVLYVQDNINWEAGQEIVLTTSRHEDTENEVATIASVVGRRILLAKPLKYYHHGDSDYQIEVGLLSRRIKFMGAEDSHASSFGGHVMAMGESQFAAGVLKRSYITDNSIRHSFFRATTVHGTHNATVAYNVAYDVMGHGLYLEDGIEENNTLAHNLMANIKPIGVPASGSLADVPVQYDTDYSLTVARHPSDGSAGCYFISNAYNNFYGNAASGGWAGYLFPSFGQVVGPSAIVFNATGIVPNSRPTLRFEGNSAHSSGTLYSYGGSFYFGGQLIQTATNLEFRVGIQGIHDPRTRDLNTPTSMSFVNTKVFLSNNGFGSWANRIDINGYESHDNVRATQIFGQSSVKNALVNGKSRNLLALLVSARVGFPVLSSDAQSIITATEFRNFLGQAIPFKPTTSPSSNRVATTVTKAIIYTNVDNVFGLTNSAPFFNLIDSDGSASNTAGLRSTLVGSPASKWWDHDANCQSNRLNVWICSPKRPEVEVASIKLTVPSNVNKGRATLFGTNIPDASVALDLDSIVGVSNAGWHIALNAGSPVTQDITPVQVPFGHFVLFAMSYPSGTTFTITTSTGRTVSQVGTSIQSLVACTGDGYYFDGQNLYIKLIDSSLTGSSSEYFERSGLRVYNANQSAPNYRVTATCPQSSINGDFCRTSPIIPQ
eukprot:gene19808-23728_t